jgi:ADP-ribose pyrophosphatase YjhB (NUDIX family)
MTPTGVTTDLLHQLVAGSHAEGTTRLAVAAVIEHDHRVLLIADPGDNFDSSFQPPTDLVLPGETLLDALARTVTVTTGLNLHDVTGYLGHHDHPDTDGQVVRVFHLAVTVTDPHQLCRTCHIGHWWAEDLPDPSPPTLPPTRAPLARHRPKDSPLATPLRAHARGIYTLEAAVELLIAHRTWLHRDDFHDRFVHTTSSSGHPTTAHIDWPAAITALDTGELPCSSSQDRILRLAASLADGILVDLRTSLNGLDATNHALLVQAIHHSNGNRQRQHPTNHDHL